ncbi:MAG: hypothetical protein WB523_12305, partial [Candidatus Sulfotelmatobacter sp.]
AMRIPLDAPPLARMQAFPGRRNPLCGKQNEELDPNRRHWILQLELVLAHPNAALPALLPRFVGD